MSKETKLKSVLNALIGGSVGQLMPMSRTGFRQFYSKVSAVRVEDLVYLYEHDSIAQKMVDDVANEATKLWRQWHSNVEDFHPEEVMKLEKRLGVKSAVTHAIKQARLYGGSVLVLNIADGQKLSEAVDYTHPFFQLLSMKSYTQYELSENNDFSEGVPEVVLFENGQRVHRDRLCFFSGTDVRLLPKAGGGEKMLGSSVLFRALRNLYDYYLTEEAISKMVQQPFVDIYQLDFDKYAKKGITPTEIQTAMRKLNAEKGGERSITIDAGDKYNVEYRHFDTLVELQMAQMKKMSADASIPMSRLFGESVGGLSVGAEDEARKYYERITDYQKSQLEASLVNLDKAMKVMSYGAVLHEVDYTWKSLWEMSPKEELDVEMQRANLIKIYLEAGVISVEEARNMALQSEGMTHMLHQKS